MGVTPKLNDIQKLADCLDDVRRPGGTLALAFSWYAAGKKEIKYAEESVMVG